MNVCQIQMYRAVSTSPLALGKETLVTLVLIEGFRVLEQYWFWVMAAVLEVMCSIHAFG